MTPADFERISCQILGSVIGWQSRIARAIGVNDRTVRRWLQAGEIPEWVEEKLAHLMGRTDAGIFPRDEWILGDGPPNADGHRREYLIHTAPPRFICRVAAMDMLDTEQPIDLETGTVYRAESETVLCEFEWIDQPTPRETAQLMDAAADAIDLISGE